MRHPSLDRDFPPTIGIDPGSACTAIVARVGRQCVAARLVLNPERPHPAAPSWAIPASPEVGYAEQVYATALAVADEQVRDACDWWSARGIDAYVRPWLLSVEKTNLPSWEHGGRRVPAERMVEILASVHGGAQVGQHIITATQGRAILVRPHQADTRWQTDLGGTGNPHDYYPRALLGGYPTSEPAGGWPALADVRGPAGEVTRIKDVAAGWSVASDAAEDYVTECHRLRGGLVAPQQAADVLAMMRARLTASLATRAGQRIAAAQVIDPLAPKGAA